MATSSRQLACWEGAVVLQAGRPFGAVSSSSRASVFLVTPAMNRRPGGDLCILTFAYRYGKLLAVSKPSLSQNDL